MRTKIHYKEKLKKQIVETIEAVAPYDEEIIPEAEHPFMYSRKWAFDYSISRLKIAVEYDGIVYKPNEQRGGHQTPKGMINDQEKRNEAQIRGWIVLIANQTSVDNKTFMDQLKRAIKVRRGDIRYE